MAPDPRFVLDGHLLAMWEQTVAAADMRGLDPPAANAFNQGIAPIADGSYVVVPQGFVGPAGGDDGVWVANALRQAAQFSGGFQGAVVRLMPTTYNFLSSVPMGVAYNVIGSGKNATIINHAFTGDAFRQTFTGSYSGQTTVGGGVQQLTIDGTNSGAGSSGIHAGDIESLNYDQTFIRNFQGAGSFGYHFDNTVNFTERMQGSIRFANCTVGVGFDVSGALTSTGSYAHADMDIYGIVNNPGQVGILLNNGANFYDARMFQAGNINAVASGVAPIWMQITGTVPAGHPGAGNGSQITLCELYIGVEASSGVVPPQTINFGSGANLINGCTGVIDFSEASAMAASNNNGNFSFYGPVFGDNSLKVNQLTNQYTTLSSSFPAGITGTIRLFKMQDPALVFVEMNLTIAATTVITTGETIATFAAPYIPANTRAFTLIQRVNGVWSDCPFSLSNSTGTLLYEGAGFTASGLSNFFGTATYANSG